MVYLGKKYRIEGSRGKSDQEARKRAEAAWRAAKTQFALDAEEAQPTGPSIIM